LPQLLSLGPAALDALIQPARGGFQPLTSQGFATAAPAQHSQQANNGDPH
jgi:hypothetical protein